MAKTYLNIDGEKALLERADAWRPWRAYACMYLSRHAMEV